MNDEQKLEIVETATANASSLRGAAELFKQMGAIYNSVAVRIAMDLKARLSSNDDWFFVEVCSDPYWQKEKFIRLKHVKSGVNKKCKVRIAAHTAILKFDRRVALRSAMPAAFLCRQCIPASLHRAATSVLQADSIMPDPM